MKRNYLSAGILTLLSSATLTLAITAAPTEVWHRAGQEAKAPAKIEKRLTPQTQYKRTRGISNSNSQIRPQGDGIQRSPIQKRKYGAPLRTVENPRGNIYAVVNRHATMEYAHEAFVGKVDMGAGTITPMFFGGVWCPYIGEDYTFQTNVYRKGQVFCPSMGIVATGEGDQYTYGWNVVDFETGDKVGYVSFGTDIFGAPYSLAYDENHDVFYGVSLGESTGSQFCIFHPDKFNYDGTPSNDALEYLGNVGSSSNYISAIVYNPLDDSIYGFDQTNTAYKITPTPKDPMNKVEVMEAGFLQTDIELFQEAITTPMVYSPMDEMFVLTYPDNSRKENQILFIDPNDWEVYDGNYITSDLRPYIASLICTDEFADADAPELAAKPVLKFDKANLKGTITFTTPKYTYYGVEIGSAKMDVVLKADDKVVFEGKMSADETKTVDVEFTEGLHQITLVTLIDGKASPTAYATIYTGNDNPVAPTGLALDIDVLTWNEPGEVGVHGGYVDTSLLEYDIFVDGVQQNASPVETNRFKLRLPASMKRANIEVVARANRKESERASISGVIGKALTVPVRYAPTREEYALFNNINANNDEQAWFFSNINNNNPETGEVIESYPAAVFNIGYFRDANDWLILPAINFPSTEALYNFAFKLASPGPNDTSEESFAIYLGKRPTVEDLTNGVCIFKRDNYIKSHDLWDNLAMNFAVPEAGNYYIGIHCYSSKSNDAWGMYVRDFAVTTVDGQTSAVPGDSENINLKPGEFGDQSATITMTVPTVDLAGKPLDPNSEITIDIRCVQTEETAQAKGKPGETVSLLCYTTGHDGFADFEITPSNENGAGYTRVRRVYVGIDVPLAPTNIKGMPYEDNMGMTLTWDAPGNVGANGAYVRQEDLTYNIYTRSGVSYFKVGSTKELTTKFEVGTPTLDGYYVGPAAQNAAGESVGSQFVQDQLGKPYDAPVKEYWNTSAFTMNPYTFMTTGKYAGSSWENTGMLEVFGPTFQGATVQQGALISFSTVGGPTETMLITPKICTKGILRANYMLRYWDNIDTPELRIYGRRNGHNDLELLHTFVPQNPERGRWAEGVFAVPAEYLDCSWVQFRIEASLTGAETEYLALDTWQLFPDCEYDLGITSFTGTTQASLGDQLTYNVKVTNAGSERNSGTLDIELVGDDNKVYATSKHTITDLTSTSIFECNPTFDLTGEFEGVTHLTVRATVTSPNDEAANNNVREISLDVKSAQIPSVSDLKGVPGETGIDFTWSTPKTTYGDFENFEYIPAFGNSETLGMWKNIDHDKFEPIALAMGATKLEWDGYEKPCGWTVVDAEKLGLQGDQRGYTRSGKQYLMARCAWVPDGKDPGDYQASDWLISPVVEGGTKFSFWVNTLSADTEYFEIWYSSTGTELGTISKLRPNECGDFKGRIPKSKSGADTWEQVVYDVPRNAKYVAIRFCSYDGLCLLIDDISFTPAEMLTREPDHYALFRSDNGGQFNLVADNIKGNAFTDATYADTDANYHLLAYNDVDGTMMAGPMSNNVFIKGSSVGTINGETAIAGRTGEVLLVGFEGQNVEIFSTDGKVMYNTVARAQRASFGLAPGIYLVKAAGKQAKVVVK